MDALNAMLAKVVPSEPMGNSPRNPDSGREDYADLTKRACRKDEAGNWVDELARGAVAKRAIPIAWSCISEWVYVREDAEDLTMQTAMSAVKKAGAYDPGKGSESTWVYALAKGHVLNYYRKIEADLVTRALEGQTPVAAETKPNNDEATRERHAAFVQELMRLAEGRQPWLPVMIELKFWYCLSFGAIAMALKLPAGTVKSGWRRFRKELQEEIGPDAATTEP